MAPMWSPNKRMHKCRRALMYSIAVLLFSYLIVPSYTANAAFYDDQPAGASLEAKAMVAIVFKHVPNNKNSSLLYFTFLFTASAVFMFYRFVLPSFAFRSTIPLLLKRLFLQPIKYTSTYVGASESA